MQPTFLVGVDLGSTSIKAVLFDADGGIHGEAYRSTPVKTVGTGAEFPVQELTRTAWDTLADVVRQAGGGDRIAGIAFASVGESFVAFDADGSPLDDVIAWYDERAAEEADAIVETIGQAKLFEMTGLSVEPIYTLCKMLWLRRHRPSVVENAAGIALMADWLAFSLCGERATDISLATRTLLASPARGTWSRPMLDAFRIDEALLPPIRPTGTALGRPTPEARAVLGLSERCVVSVGGHDHILSSCAAGASEPGVVVDSAGTAEAVLRTGPYPVSGWPAGSLEFAQGGIWWSGDTAPRVYLLGALFDSGSAMERFKQGTDRLADWNDLIAQATAAPASSIYRPELGTALRHDPEAWVEAVFEGTGTTNGALFRALLEGLALDSSLLCDTLTRHAGLPPADDVRLVGGGARNALYAELKAAAFGKPIKVAEFPELTALGAAIAAGLGAGIYRSLDDALARIDLEWRRVEPRHELMDAVGKLQAARATVS